MSKNLTIFDADFLLYSATMGIKCLDDEGNPIKEDNKFVYTPRTEQEVYECADDIITNILDKTQADYFIGYLGGCKSFRYTIYPEYKANRKLDKPPFFVELKEYLINKWKFIYTKDGLEADDAVNIVRNNLQNDFNCTIVSSDKDLIKSIAGTYLNTRNLEIVETSNDEASRFFWESMVCGDSIDNIKGLQGKGIKFVGKILDLAEELKTPYSMEIFNQYLLYYNNEQIGIDEFYKNYKCLHILDKFDNFEIPSLNEWNVLRELGEI